MTRDSVVQTQNDNNNNNNNKSMTSIDKSATCRRVHTCTSKDAVALGWTLDSKMAPRTNFRR